jgi:hypothetical protein
MIPQNITNYKYFLLQVISAKNGQAQKYAPLLNGSVPLFAFSSVPHRQYPHPSATNRIAIQRLLVDML